MQTKIKTMAESESPKEEAPVDVEAQSADAAAEVQEVDAILNEVDPEFAKSIEVIGQDVEKMKIDIESSDFESALAESAPGATPRRMGFKDHLKRALRYLGDWIKFVFFKIIGVLDWIIEVLWQTGLFILFSGRKKFISGLLHVLKSIGGAIKGVLAIFERWSVLKKLAFFALVGGTAGTVWLSYVSLTRGLIDRSVHLFLPSFAEAGKGYDFETEDVEGFYDSIRHPQNVFQLNKMVVNLRKSPKSGPTPMGAFQFYVDASSKETLVEIKDREVELRDLIQRSLEELNYDEIANSYGKTNVRDRVKDVLNGNLTTGRIRKVMLANLILKP